MDWSGNTKRFGIQQGRTGSPYKAPGARQSQLNQAMSKAHRNNAARKANMSKSLMDSNMPAQMPTMKKGMGKAPPGMLTGPGAKQAISNKLDQMGFSGKKFDNLMSKFGGQNKKRRVGKKNQRKLSAAKAALNGGFRGRER